MAELEQRERLLDEIFNQYDVFKTGELTSEQLQVIHSDMRPGGISIPQIKESIKYVCVHDNCERSELFDLLQEMDRRYFLTENFRWEFSLLDTEKTDTIPEEQAKWFMETAHMPYFSSLQWKRFIKNRAVPGSGVSFSEIEVPLCNIPSREDWLADLEEERREKEEEEQRLHELQKRAEEEKERKKRLRDEERKKREEEALKRKLELERRKREEEEERQQRIKDKEDAAIRKRKLEEEEERGRKEAEEREKKRLEQRDLEEKQRRQKEEEELRRLEELERKRYEEEETQKKQELKEAEDYESIIKDVLRKEREAEEEAIRHQQRIQATEDDQVKKDAIEAEERAMVKKREYRNKRIRYNLKLAIKRRDHKLLTKAVADFNKAKLPDDDHDLPKAERILKEFSVRDGLKKAVIDRQLKPLERAINNVKYNGFELQLHKELIEANKVLLHLRRLERIRAEILELKQSTVAEIRSYQNPPAVVHVVMTATFLLLGHKEKETKDWKNVQALVGKTGKEGLKRRCLQSEPLKIDREAAARAKVLLQEHELDEVRDVSAGAATFFLWSWTMIEESEAQREAKKREEEEKKRLQEEKRLRQQEILKDNPDAVFSDDEELEKKPKTPPAQKEKRQYQTISRRSVSLPPSRTPSNKQRSKSVDATSADRVRKMSSPGEKPVKKVTSKSGGEKHVTDENKETLSSKKDTLEEATDGAKSAKEVINEKSTAQETPADEEIEKKAK